jgi:hypothetical protein
MHLNQMTEKCYNLKCFSKAHFICQNAIHTILVQQLKQTGTSTVFDNVPESMKKVRQKMLFDGKKSFNNLYEIIYKCMSIPLCNY